MTNSAKLRTFLADKTKDLALEPCTKLITGAQRACNISTKAATRRVPYWWTEIIERTKGECNRLRRRLTRLRRRNIEQANLVIDAYGEAKRILRREIRREKRRRWQQLCDDLKADVWGDAYKIAMREIKSSTPEYTTSLERKWAIVTVLFPRREDQWEKAQGMEVQQLITAAELSEAVKALKVKKAPGPDRIATESVKALWEVAPDYIRRVLNGCWLKGDFPKMWKKSRVVFIPKPGRDLEEAGAYRPLSVINTMGKLYEGVLRNRLTAEIEALGAFSDSQHGFRKGRSTITTVGTVRAISRGTRSTWCILITVDVKNAFNTASWGCIMRHLERLGISVGLRKLVGNYLKDRGIILDGEEMEMTCGVQQSSVIGPTL